MNAARYSLLAGIRDVDPPSSVRVPVDGVYRGEKGAIAKADQAVGTGGEHRLQGIPGQGRRLGGRAHAARDVPLSRRLWVAQYGFLITRVQ
ncbi:MAG: hypothetical protein JWL65_5397 [Gammaproteobacteria bacterium]|nr:hypothetical protein [Gammaproteobacteria bacterium]